MIIKKISGIYAISPNQALNLSAIEQLFKQYAINVLQYRHKTNDPHTKLNEAKQLQQLCWRYNTVFIINDDINLSEKIKADGVHLGKNDGSIWQARQQLKDGAIIGVSCYADIGLAQKAQDLGADYVAFGALFPSNTKPDVAHCPLDIITQAKQTLDIPIVGIGGINFSNQQQAFDAGCDAVAMINALWANLPQSID